MKTRLDIHTINLPRTSSGVAAPSPQVGESSQALEVVESSQALEVVESSTIMDLPADVRLHVLSFGDPRQVLTYSLLSRAAARDITQEIKALSALKYWAKTPIKSPSPELKIPGDPKSLQFSEPQLRELEGCLASDNLKIEEHSLAQWISELPIADEIKKNLMRNVRAEWDPKCWPVMEILGFDISELKEAHERCCLIQDWDNATASTADISVMGRAVLKPRVTRQTLSALMARLGLIRRPINSTRRPMSLGARRLKFETRYGGDHRSTLDLYRSHLRALGFKSHEAGAG